MMVASDADERFWIPDNPDGSGWADVDWVSASRGSRYHYRHVGSAAEEARLPAFYRVVTRLESEPYTRTKTAITSRESGWRIFLPRSVSPPAQRSFGTSNPVRVRLGKADSVPSKRSKQRGGHIGRPVRLERSRMITNEGGS